MKDRSDATNYFREKVEITAAELYLRELRNEGYKGIGFLHFFLAAYVKTVAQYPAINRFISGQRIYARNGIVIVMTVKKKLSIDSGESEIKLFVEPTDGIRDIFAKISVEIEKIKSSQEEDSTEKVAGILMKMPRFILRGAMRFFGWLDYHGWLPTYLLYVSPFHGSIVVTDLGSLGIGPVYHHIYNFGNVPVFLAFGVKKKEFELTADGTVAEKKYMEFTIASDERICDGHYYAQAIKYLKYIFRNPKILDEPTETVVEDVD